jgi:hypothetical protein
VEDGGRGSESGWQRSPGLSCLYQGAKNYNVSIPLGRYVLSGAYIFPKIVLLATLAEVLSASDLGKLPAAGLDGTVVKTTPMPSTILHLEDHSFLTK